MARFARKAISNGVLAVVIILIVIVALMGSFIAVKYQGSDFLEFPSSPTATAFSTVTLTKNQLTTITVMNPPGPTSETVAQGTFNLPAACPTCIEGINLYHTFSFIVHSSAKNAELRSNYVANSSFVGMSVYNQGNYSKFEGAGGVPFYRVQNTTNNFDFLMPSGDTFYIVFSGSVQVFAMIMVDAVLTYQS